MELSDGESFMIGGLLDKTETDSFQKIPFIGDIPILGKLFQSEVRTKNDTELIVIVTPEIVSPIRRAQPVPKLQFPGAIHAAEFEYRDASAGCEDAGEHAAAAAGIDTGGEAC